MKRFTIITFILVLFVMLTACGPSSEELSALTADAEITVAVEWTDTPEPTDTPTPTTTEIPPTATPTITPSPTITPTPSDPNLLAHDILLHEYEVSDVDAYLIDYEHGWFESSLSIVKPVDNALFPAVLLQGPEGMTEQNQYFPNPVSISPTTSNITIRGDGMLDFVIDQPSRWAGARINAAGQTVQFMFTGDEKGFSMAILRPGVGSAWDELKWIDAPTLPITIKIVFIDDTVYMYQNDQLAGSRTDPIYAGEKSLEGFTVGYDVKYQLQRSIRWWGNEETQIIETSQDYVICSIVSPENGTSEPQTNWGIELNYDFPISGIQNWSLRAYLERWQEDSFRERVDLTQDGETFEYFRPLEATGAAILEGQTGIVWQPGKYELTIAFTQGATTRYSRPAYYAVCTVEIQTEMPDDDIAAIPLSDVEDASDLLLQVAGSPVTRFDGESEEATPVVEELLGYDYIEDISPDGSQLLLSSFYGSKEDNFYFDHMHPGKLYVVDVDGSDPLELTNNLAFTSEDAAIWLDDGSDRIAFLAYESGRLRVFTIHSDGSDLTEIYALSQDAVALYPAFSAEEQTLYWEQWLRYSGSARSDGIWSLKLDEPESADKVNGTTHVYFDPTGHFLIETFHGYTVISGEKTYNQTVGITPLGDPVLAYKLLDQEEYAEDDPIREVDNTFAWSPDGQVVLIGLNGGHRGYVIAAFDDYSTIPTSIIHLSDGMVDQIGPSTTQAWSPDRSQIAFVGEEAVTILDLNTMEISIVLEDMVEDGASIGRIIWLP